MTCWSSNRNLELKQGLVAVVAPEEDSGPNGKLGRVGERREKLGVRIAD
jgi:hypothetical protein